MNAILTCCTCPCDLPAPVQPLLLWSVALHRATPTVPWPPRDLLACGTCHQHHHLHHSLLAAIRHLPRSSLSRLALPATTLASRCQLAAHLSSLRRHHHHHCSFSSFACETLYTLTARANDDHGKNKNCSRSTQCRSQLECSCRCSCCAKSLIKSDQNPVHHRSSLSTRAASEPNPLRVSKYVKSKSVVHHDE